LDFTAFHVLLFKGEDNKYVDLEKTPTGLRLLKKKLTQGTGVSELKEKKRKEKEKKNVKRGHQCTS